MILDTREKVRMHIGLNKHSGTETDKCVQRQRVGVCVYGVGRRAETERGREGERERERERERQTDRQTDTERQRERQRDSMSPCKFLKSARKKKKTIRHVRLSTHAVL